MHATALYYYGHCGDLQPLLQAGVLLLVVFHKTHIMHSVTII